MFFGHVHGKILPLILQHLWAWVSFHHVQRTDPDSKSLSLLLPYFTLRPFCACQDSFAYLQLACLSLVLPHGPRPNDLKGLADHNLALNMSKAVRQMKFWRCPLASSRFCTQTLYYQVESNCHFNEVTWFRIWRNAKDRKISRQRVPQARSKKCLHWNLGFPFYSQDLLPVKSTPFKICLILQTPSNSLTCILSSKNTTIYTVG